MSKNRASLPILLAAAVLSTACIQGGGTSPSREVDLGPVDAIEGLVGASTGDRWDPPELLAGATPELPDDLERALRDVAEPVEAVVRVLIAADGSPMGVKVTEATPAGSDVARRYAEEVARQVWLWRYSPASRDGAPVRGYLDLRFRSGA